MAMPVSLLMGNGHGMTYVMQNRQYFITLLTEASQLKPDSTLSDRKDSTRCMSSLPHLKENRF